MRFLSTLLLVLGAVTLQAEETYADISYDDLTAAIAAKTVTLLDANGTAAYAKHHITGALDFEVLKTAGTLATVLPEDKAALVVAYCGGPACKAYVAAAKAASDLGYTNVKHFSGGISGWLEKNPPAEEAATPSSSAMPMKKPSGCSVGTR